MEVGDAGEHGAVVAPLVLVLVERGGQPVRGEQRATEDVGVRRVRRRAGERHRDHPGEVAHEGHRDELREQARPLAVRAGARRRARRCAREHGVPQAHPELEVADGVHVLVESGTVGGAEACRQGCGVLQDGVEDAGAVGVGWRGAEQPLEQVLGEVRRCVVRVGPRMRRVADGGARPVHAVQRRHGEDERAVAGLADAVRHQLVRRRRRHRHEVPVPAAAGVGRVHHRVAAGEDGGGPFHVGVVPVEDRQSGARDHVGLRLEAGQSAQHAGGLPAGAGGGRRPRVRVRAVAPEPHGEALRERAAVGVGGAAEVGHRVEQGEPEGGDGATAEGAAQHGASRQSARHGVTSQAFRNRALRATRPSAARMSPLASVNPMTSGWSSGTVTPLA